MPTISQLPSASQVSAADQIPISQGGAVCSVSVGTLLAGTQPAILAATGTLLGRSSLGAGGPDQIAVGTGLLLNADTLVATGGDHADFSLQGTLTLSDEAVLNSAGVPKLLQLSLLRGLFAPGSNISIDQFGTISATLTGGISSGYGIATLPTVTTIAPGDLVAISQASADHTVTYANFINGETIDQTQTAAAASDTDAFLVGQNGNIMARQSLGAIWVWISSKLPSYQLPTTELVTDTTLNAAAHNGHLLICSQPITVSAVPVSLGSGFVCNMINLSCGDVTLESGIITSSGASALATGEASTLTCATYSGGTLLYAWMSGSVSSSTAPAQVTGVTVGFVTTSSVLIAWAALSPSPVSYTVQYRISGTSGWSAAPSVTAPACTVAGLLAATSYDFAVLAANSAGCGSPSGIVTTVTSAGVSAPGQVTGLAASNATASAVSLAWSPPSTGGVASSYTVQYRVSGAPSWSTGGSGITAVSFVVTGLLPATSYDFEVVAINAAGTGPASAVVTASTATAGTSATSITWEMVPSGSYAHSTGSIGVNAQVSPNNAPVQFGFSTSPTVPPTSWTAGSYVNSNLWGAYVNTPSVAGTWYAWVEGTDGSSPTVYPTGFSVT